MDAEEIIAQLLMSVKAAIASGDWKVDGACDPDHILWIAEDYLRDNGWVTDGITGEQWFKERT